MSQNNITTLQFTVGFSHGLDEHPAEMVTATVPGAVQLDWEKTHDNKPYYYAENFRDFGWMEDVFWHYQTIFSMNPEPGTKTILYAKGIDYQYRIRLNGQTIYEHEGMFSPVKLDISEYLVGENVLDIDIYPVPKKPGVPEGRSQASSSCKPAVSYGWDWHPRLIPLGIWDDIWIETYHGAYIEDFSFQYELLNHYTDACFTSCFVSSEPDTTFRFQILDGDDPVYIQTGFCCDKSATKLDGILEKVKLWWPNGYGKQNLYNVVLEIFQHDKIMDTHRIKVGFKSAQLVVHENGWEKPNKMPKSRSHAPITMQLNGKRIFCKGSNWVLPEIFYGTIDEEEYRTLLTFAKEANFNMLRVWGGGIVNKESFYDICDQLGILVWQEFPLSCNDYANDNHYLSVLEEESVSIIKRLRQHACLALWCGGNELFNAWSGMTEQSYALRLLDKNCYIYDRHTPFIMTSPLDGMAHGGYVFREENGREVYEIINHSHNTAYTEFGCPSISDYEILKLAMPEEEIYPPSEQSSWTAHHGFFAWKDQCWACLDTLEYYFGKSNSIGELITQSNLLQSEGFKAIFEEARRQQPICSMVLNWNFNETWPTAAGNHIITWDHRKKPAYYAVKNALRMVMTSARNQKLMWYEGEVFEAELWVLNDSFDKQHIGEIHAFLEIDGKEYGNIQWTIKEVQAQANVPGPIFRTTLPKATDGIMTLHLKVAGKGEMDSDYQFIYRSQKEKNECCGVRVLNQ